MMSPEIENEAPVLPGRSLVGSLGTRGDHLSRAIAEGPLDVSRALHIARQIALALADAHARGILHRHLNPDDVTLVERDGDLDFVEVLDFDIAGFADFEATSAETPEAFARSMGLARRTSEAPSYMSPEQELGRAVDARADLYALGVVMFEMLTGARPFESEGEHMVSALKVMYDPPAMTSANSDVRVPPAVEELVRRLLERDASDRFSSALDVVAAIEACVRRGPVASVRVRRAAMAPQPLWVRLRPFFLSDLLAGFAAVLLLFFVSGALLRSPVTPADILGTRRSAAPTLDTAAALSNHEPPTDIPAPPTEDAPGAIEPPVTIESRHAVPPKLVVRKKRPQAITDLGGRR